MKKDRIKESKEDAEFTVTQLNTVPYIPGDIESLLKKKGLFCDPKEFLEYLEKEGEELETVEISFMDRVRDVLNID